MKKSILIVSVILLSSSQMFSQEINNDDYKAIMKNNENWNLSYNNRDTLTFFSLFNDKVTWISGGGKWYGKENLIAKMKRQYEKRPDIFWNNKIEKIEVNENWPVAYETGVWTENWTEKGDSKKSEIIGKYFMMYKKKNGNWLIDSVIFTPVSCTGSYCEK